MHKFEPMTSLGAYARALRLFMNRAPIDEFADALKFVPTRYLEDLISEVNIFIAESGADRDGSADAWEEHLTAIATALEGTDECDFCENTVDRDDLKARACSGFPRWLCPSCTEDDDRGALRW